MERLSGEGIGTAARGQPTAAMGSASHSSGSNSGAAGGGGVDNAECWDSISYLESAFHHGFMRSRIMHGEFVYQENPRLARELDEFCDVDAMQQPKGPIIVLGESGVGKSALLANWLVRRKKTFQNWQTAYPEFIFYHVVGCSRQSCFVSNLLERILREIKDYFELNKDIPDVEERLGWQLPRFLEAASKKGRVILIIDGLQRLRTSNGESILKWVPLAFPPNVRIIFSGTSTALPATKFVSSSAAGSIGGRSGPSSEPGPLLSASEPYDKTSVNAQMIERIKLEANRRKWTSVHVPALSEDERHMIVKKFLRKHKAQSTGSLTTSDHVGHSNAHPSAPDARLRLFELQERAIVAVPTTASPNFLKLLLTSLAWAADAGFNIHEVVENWLGAESIGQLVEAILRSMETGYTPTPQGTDDARQFLAENGYGAADHVVSALQHPTRRKCSADAISTADPPPLAADTESRSASERISSHRARPERASAQPKEYGYRDARIPSAPAVRVDKTTVSPGVIELGYADAPPPLQQHLDAKASSDDEGVTVLPPSLTRMQSVHETKEVFVSSLRSDKSRNRLTPLTPDGALERPTSVDAAASATRLESGDTSPDRHAPLHAPPRPMLSQDSKHAVSVRIPASKTPLEQHRELLPAYIAGGQPVSPLGELLGRAFCLLYVCRHGLLTNELRFILNAIVTEERESSQPLHRKATFSNVKNLDAHRLTGFAEPEWKALLRALKVLGVLFVQDVLVLPLCKEVVREVVWWRYIGSERREQTYHQWLIRFFRIHPTTFRRVEELPWHLQRCYQWDALRTVLVSLPMFQLLYTANYKHELFGYWKTLTDGPLLLYTAANANTGGANEPLVYTLPFDVVKEYSKSMEDWYKSARPPTKTFTQMVQLVTKFMFEFSLAYQGHLPAFNYAPLDLKRLQNDGFAFTEDLPHVLALPSSTTAASGAASTAGSHGSGGAGGLPLAASSTAVASSGLVVALEAFSTLVHGPSGLSSSTRTSGSSMGTRSALMTTSKEKEVTGNWFYFYQRWVWIHFPWLALGKEIVVREPVVSPTSAVCGSGVGVSSGNSSATLSYGSSSATGSGTLELSRVLSTSAVGDADDEEQRRESHGTGHALAPLHVSGDGATTVGSGVKPVVHFDARFWDVKRSMFESASSGDAPQHRVRKTKGAMSPPKLTGLQNASVLSPAPTTTTQDVISPESLFRKKATYVAVKNVLSSSIRRLPTAVATASLPLANVAVVAATATATTFLTDAGGGLGLGTVASPHALARASPGARDLVLEHLNVSDLSPSPSVAFGLPAHFQDYPQSEWDLKQSYNHQVVLKLQTLYDSMKAEVAQKHAHVQLVKKKIQETTRRYELMLRDCDMAKHAIAEMGARMDRIELLLSSIDRQEKSHRKLLRGCETFPACEPTHFDTVKKELKLLQMRLKDLVEERKVLHVKKTHLQSMELPLLRAAVEKSKTLMSAVVERLEKARAKVAQDLAATAKLYERRLEMIESVHHAAFQGAAGETLEDAERSASSQRSASTTTRSLAAKVALQQCEAMVEKIQKATGYTKLELILQKFVSREELNRSFEEQAKIYEARLKQIKLHQAELEQQLKSLEMSNAAVATDDPRVLEEQLRVAELELARVERTQNGLLTTSKEVVAGASRIVRLLGITSCRNPNEGAVPAAQLWPPAVGLDSDSSLLSEFESLEPKEIAMLLQACQERTSLMIDAVRVVWCV